MAAPLLEIDRLGISFFTRAAEIPAVMDFSCRIMPGQAMGLVGESGCGKSTVALAILRDLPGLGRITNGAIRFEGRDMASLHGRGAARDPRLEDRDGLSGADGLAQSDHARRPAIDGSAADPRQGLTRRSPSSRRRHGQGRAPARSRPRHARLSASAERRPAAARRDRDGAAVEAEAAHPRRADHRARRHGGSGHRRARQGPHRPHRRFVAVHLPQSRAHPRDLRRSDGDVFGRGGRERRGQRRVRRGAPPLHAGPVPLDPDAGNEQERQSAYSHSRPAAAAA